MLILFTILVVLSAVALLAISVRRRSSNLLEENPPKNLSAASFRPLFQPTKDDIRAFEREEKLQADAKKVEDARRILEEKFEKVREFEKVWRELPDRKKTIELLFLASQTESAKTFSEISGNVIKFWRENRIESLNSKDLADLLDSHFRTLPQQERTSGIGFWLKEEIENLRTKSEEKL
jgi:serine/threonine-protein kinase RIO1